MHAEKSQKIVKKLSAELVCGNVSFLILATIFYPK